MVTLRHQCGADFVFWFSARLPQPCPFLRSHFHMHSMTQSHLSFYLSPVMLNQNQAVYIVGECALALLAYLVRDWRTLVLLCAASCAAFLPTVFLMPESPRWLLSQVQAGRQNTEYSESGRGAKPCCTQQPYHKADSLMHALVVPVPRLPAHRACLLFPSYPPQRHKSQAVAVLRFI